MGDKENKLYYDSLKIDLEWLCKLCYEYNKVW